MQWRNILGFGDTLALDLLFARLQITVLCGSGETSDLKIGLPDRLASLQMHLNPVREKAEVIKRMKSSAFLKDVTASELEDARLQIRVIIHRRVKGGSQGVPSMAIDITADAGQTHFARHPTSLKFHDMKANQQIVEAEFKKHFETNPVLKKIRVGDAVSDRKIYSLTELILAQNSDVCREHLDEFFSEIARQLHLMIRTIIGIDPDAIRERLLLSLKSIRNLVPSRRASLR